MSSYQSRPRFEIGSMRHRITIEQLSVLADTTSGEFNETWESFLTSEPAAYDEVRGGETFRGSQVEATIAAIFTVRHNASLAPTMRVSFNNRYYGIVFCRRVRGYDRYLELHCKTVDNYAVG